MQLELVYTFFLYSVPFFPFPLHCLSLSHQIALPGTPQEFPNCSNSSLHFLQPMLHPVVSSLLLPGVHLPSSLPGKLLFVFSSSVVFSLITYYIPPPSIICKSDRPMVVTQEIFQWSNTFQRLTSQPLSPRESSTCILTFKELCSISVAKLTGNLIK